MRRLIAVLLGAVAASAVLSAPATALSADPPPSSNMHGGVDVLTNAAQRSPDQSERTNRGSRCPLSCTRARAAGLTAEVVSVGRALAAR
jgi:hypothetical protein